MQREVGEGEKLLSLMAGNVCGYVRKERQLDHVLLVDAEGALFCRSDEPLMSPFFLFDHICNVKNGENQNRRGKPQP